MELRGARAPALRLPTLPEAQEVARNLLGDQGTRLAHVHTAGSVASRLAVLFDPAEAQLLAVAATLHDIGYSPRISQTGFHPLDGANFLLREGYPERLASLVAHHSLARLTADEGQARELEQAFPLPEGLLGDALTYADMHSAPDGRIIPVEHRLADIGARHHDPVQEVRARRIRIAVARVGTALLQAHEDRWGRAEGASAVSPGQPGGARGDAARTAQFGMTLPHVGPDEVAPHAGVSTAFESWWSAELRYTRQLEAYEFGLRAGSAEREAALRLAHLRSRADVRRDRYFRAALA